MQIKSKQTLEACSANFSPLWEELKRGREALPLLEIGGKKTALLKKVQACFKQTRTFQHAWQEVSHPLSAREAKAEINELALLFVNLKGQVTAYNSALQQILEVEPQLVLLEEFWGNFDDQLFGFSLRQSLQEKCSPKTSYTSFLSPSGQKYELEIHTTFLPQTPSPPTHPGLETGQGLLVLVRDVTENRPLHFLDKPPHHFETLGEITASVAHEIRNPLGGIQGFASLLQRELANQPQLQKMASYIVEGTDHLNRLLTQILHFPRKLGSQFTAVNLVQLLKEMREHVEMDPALKKGIQIDLDIERPFLWIQADAQALRRAILNLMLNALQAMPYEGILTLKLRQDGECAIIQVKDTGLGITPQNLDKIFSPFFTTRAEGNGLGLAEVCKVVEIHGGQIEVRSIVQKGSEFSLKLPIKAYK